MNELFNNLILAFQKIIRHFKFFSGRIRKNTEKSRKGVCRALELDGSSVASLSGDQSSLGLLQDMLGQVKADLDTMSSDTAPEPTGSPEPYGRQGLTGFSVSLVSTIGRLVQLIRKVFLL